MPYVNPTEFTHNLNVAVATLSDGTLSYGAAVSLEQSISVYDQAGDGDVDGVDFFFDSSIPYTGYYYTAPNGNTYAIYQSQNTPTSFFIPYNAAEYDLAAVFPSGSNAVSVTAQADDFEPTGNPLCFLAGTSIQTPGGEVAVETLTPGDRICLADGGIVDVKWIGRQTVSTRFGTADRLHLVRIAAGSLGNGLPHSDLTVTADHGMVLDGVICHAGALVNGTTITAVPMAELGARYTVYHVETEAQEVILANGAPSETYIDNVSRRAFDNYAEFAALYGDDPAPMAELALPRAHSVRQVPDRLRRQLASAAAA